MNNSIIKNAFWVLAGGLLIAGCQKMERPKLGDIIPNPDPPAYSDLKSLWSFENNTTDQGENKLTPTDKNVSYVAGIKGQAAKIDAGGYILLTASSDTVIYPNEFVGVPGDTLKNLGSFTLSFWMNGAGPVTGGAQGLFSISNKSEYWGNLDLFLENYSDGGPDMAFLKVHMFNAGVTKGNGERWNEIKIPGVLNKWTHIAVTYDGNNSQFSIYADGQPTAIANKVLDDETADGGKYGKIKFNNFNGMVLGTYQFQTDPTLTNHGPEDWARSFNGALDEFRLYNRALTAAEINTLFTNKE